jgi:hypothetical protein
VSCTLIAAGGGGVDPEPQPAIRPKRLRKKKAYK